jgi:hypothetical protein
MRYVRLVVLLLIALLVPGGSVALAHSRILVREGLAYKPHELGISGDGDLWAQGLRWRSWGGKTATAGGQVVEQERPSHVDHTYRARITLAFPVYCANVHRTVYLQIAARILGPNRGVFGARTFGAQWTCTGLAAFSAGDSSATAAQACSTSRFRFTRSITARGTSCARARKVVRKWLDEVKLPHSTCPWADGSTTPGVCGVGAWRCSSYHTVNGQTYPVTCKEDAGRREIHFVNEV